MNAKIFDKWTLNFSNDEFQTLYELHRGRMRIQNFRILNGLGVVVSLLSLIVFELQNQPYYLSIIMGVGAFSCFFMLLMSRRLQRFLGFMFSIMYICCLVTNIMLSVHGNDVPDFVLGFSAGCLSIGLIEYSNNHLKIIYIVATPFILFAVFNVFNFQNIIYIFISIGCAIFVGIQLHINEYTQHSAFSLNIIAEKQRDIINEFVCDSMMAISFDNRSKQFILEYQNKQCEDCFDIKETAEMKQFLRACQYSIQVQNLNFNEKQETLEQVLFKTIHFQTSLNESEFNFSFQSSMKNQEQLLSIKIRMMNYGKPILLIIIKDQDLIKSTNNYEKRITSIQNLIFNQSKLLINQQLKILKISNKLLISNSQLPRLNALQCQSLQIISNFRNNIIYFGQEMTQRLIFNNYKFKFNYFLSSIEKYISMLATRYNQSFKIENYIHESYDVQLNSKHLSQILINIFEKAFKESISNSETYLSIQIEKAPNLFQIQQNLFQFNQTNMQDELLSFTFSYRRNRSNNQIFSESQGDSVNISDQATSYLINLLGPYNKFFSNSRQNLGQEICQINFFIYPNEDNLNISFLQNRRYFPQENRPKRI